MSLDDAQKTQEVFDIIIVGAGFAGMSAALHLSDCNIDNICILEGNNRIGGRVYNEKVILDKGNETRWDAGGAYIGPYQNRLLNLCDRFNVQTYKVYSKGQNISKYNNEISVFEGIEMPVKNLNDLLSSLDWNHFIRNINYLARKLSSDDDSYDKLTNKYKNMTILDWLNENITNTKAKEQILAAIEVNYCIDVSKMSFLGLLDDISGLAHQNIIYSMENEGGAQDRKCTNYGTFGVLVNIMQHLTNTKSIDILLNQVVCQIELSSCKDKNDKNDQNERIFTVKCKNNKIYKSRYVILTAPPNKYETINFLPKLDENKLNFIKNNMEMGRLIKCNVFYKNAFWRDMNYSGMIFNVNSKNKDKNKDKDNYGQNSNQSKDYVIATFDDSKPVLNKTGKIIDWKDPSIIGFITNPDVINYEFDKLDDKDMNRRKEIICKEYARIFKDERFISQCVGYAEKIWANTTEPLIGGGYSCSEIIPATLPSSSASSALSTSIATNGKNNDDTNSDTESESESESDYWELTDGREDSILRNRLYFAGTSLATKFAGYIEGAIETGQKCAYEIGKQLKEKENKNKTNKNRNKINLIPFIENMAKPDNCQMIEKDFEQSFVEKYLIPSAKQAKIISAVVGVASFCLVSCKVVRSVGDKKLPNWARQFV